MHQEELEELIIERFLPKEALLQYKSGAVAHNLLKPYSELILDLSNRFLDEKPVHYPSKEACIAYALYYLPINFQKVKFLLEKIPESSKNKNLKVLDIGAGPGTAIFGGLGADLSIEEAVLCEESPFMQNVGRSLMNKMNFKTSWVSTIDSVQGKFDLIIAANVITEVKEKSNFVNKFLELLSNDGALLILEPGSYVATRSLMELRDFLLKSDPTLSPLFPCTHSDECPMLKNLPNDWCHGTIGNDRSRLIRDIDTLTGFNKHRTKYSAFLAARNEDTPSGFRVIGDPQKDRRGIHAMLCGKDHFGVTTAKKGSEEGKVLAKIKGFGLLEKRN